MEMHESKITLLANGIFSSLSGEIEALKLSTLDCGCVYCQRVLSNGSKPLSYEIYRSVKAGRCEKCMEFEDSWEERVKNKVVIYKSDIKMEGNE